MGRIKFGIDGAGAKLDGFYEGDPPPAGTYIGKLKRMELKKTGPQSKNPGAPMIRMVLEIVGPSSAKQYFGAGIFHNLNVTEQGAPFVNQFLNALTDGTEVAQKRIQKAFWGQGPFVDESGHFQKIGNINIQSPDGEREVVFITKMGRPYQGQARAEVVRFLVKNVDDEGVEDEEDDDELDVEVVDEVDEDDVVEDDEDDESDEDEDDLKDEDEDEDEESDEDDEDDDEESDEDDEDDEDESDEEDEDEEPVKVAAATAKRTAKRKAPF